MGKTPHSSRKKIRYHQVAQWIQAMVTLAILFLIYMIQGHVSLGSGGSPLSVIETSQTPLSVHEFTEGELDLLVFHAEDTRITFYPNASVDLVESRHVTDEARSYTQRDDGVMVVEGNLLSPLVQKAGVFLDSQ